jgi:hypothetical protein
LKVRKRVFDERGMEELQYVLSKESWQEVYLESDVNGKFSVFANIFHYYFDMVFPLKLYNQNKLQKKGWVTQGIRMSSKRMRWLNNLQKKTNLTGEEQDYIHRYRMIYKRVLKEAKKRENDRHIANAKNKTRAVWQIVKKRIRKQPAKRTGNASKMRDKNRV